MPPQVLVIDESPDMPSLLRVLFRREGVAVLSASRIDVGIDLAVSCLPDVILLDVDMPSANGFEACRMLEADPRTRSASIIFVTAGRAVSKVEALELGATDYVTKPFDPDELHLRVRVALREKRERDALAADAELDPVSGIGNRRAFERHLAARVAAHRALGEDTALVLVGLDHFESINDGLGHAFGDRVIQRTAAFLAASVRAGDIVCRIGGGELALLIPGAPLHAAQELAERLRRRLASVDMEHEGSSLEITASFGVTATSQFRGQELSGARMIAAADQALYEAKQAGRHYIEYAA